MYGFLFSLLSLSLPWNSENLPNKVEILKIISLDPFFPSKKSTKYIF